ncbi:MAG: Cof-type HAD-IIB family hydrolase [Chloroflexota bacterium]
MRETRTPRLAATDLDGTLLRSDGTASARSVAALGAAQEAGLAVVLVTGRPPRMVAPLARDLGARGLAICLNGALVLDLDSGEIVEHEQCSAEVVEALVTRLRALDREIRFAFERGTHFSCEPEYLALAPRANRTGLVVDDLDTLLDQPASKIIARHATLAHATLMELIQSQANGAVTVTASTNTIVEIAAAGVHKGRALERLCGRRGVAQETVVAFGDMPNDATMLEWAGHGVAVANAHPDVLAIADSVTLSNDEDGVAVVLERLLAG